LAGAHGVPFGSAERRGRHCQFGAEAIDVGRRSAVACESIGVVLELTQHRFQPRLASFAARRLRGVMPSSAGSF
jgi:hypothetical protein